MDISGMISSCMICLQTEEVDSMVAFKTPHDRLNPDQMRLICRSCAAVIAEAWRVLGEPGFVTLPRADEKEGDR